MKNECAVAFAKAAGYSIVETFYDSAVSGADPVSARPGFAEMLDGRVKTMHPKITAAIHELHERAKTN